MTGVAKPDQSAVGTYERRATLPARTFTPANVDEEDIQGNVLRGYTYPAAAYLFLRIDDLPRAKDLLKHMLPRITTGEPWLGSQPDTAIQIAFTATGLERMGVPREILSTFPQEFQEGMAARAALLGDVGPCAPERWEPGLGRGDAHVLVTAWAANNARLDQLRDELRVVGTSAAATTLVNETRAEALPGGRDHFGFMDGISQPAVAGTNAEPRPGDGQPNGRGKWRSVATGEFLLGYEDEDGTMPAAPAAPFDRNGTFVVYRKLEMHVAAFRSMIAEAGRRYPGGPDMLAAKIVGRWRDGTPLSVSPDRPDQAIATDPRRINDFSYADDPHGLRCPIGSHIRRVNPRDSIGFFGGKLSKRHRIVRRGRTYGPPLAEGRTEDDGVERGLVFVCFNASIWRQFETIQRLWIEDGDPFRLGVDKDFISGNPMSGGGKMTIPGHPPFFISPQPRLVTMRGGEYLFQPSMTALRWLVSV